MTDHPASIEEQLSAAIDLPAGERRAYLAEAFAGDAEALADVLSLLDAFEASEDFLERPVTLDALGLDGDEDDWVGRTIDSYTLVGFLGGGGMGRVYLAERVDRDFDQRVAIKIIRRGVMSKEVLRRFRNECRVLAMLEHPNIARMIDGGTTEDGIPFIVMEYVDGVPVDRYCDEHALSLEERLELFREVCGAVQVVHQNSTIHRDIKPANVLVSRDGRVKLVDFGIARVLEAADEPVEYTAAGLAMMTPMYASPEQVLGKPLTTATDVYSLGAVLYKLVAGRAPFAHDDRRALEEAVSGESPTRPSETLLAGESSRETRRLARRLEGDLDTIILMALRKEPERRYASAESLSEDIGRLLAGLPVSAQPDTWSYRSSKFIRRHALAVAAAGVVAVVLIAATVVSLDLYQRAESARREAVAERAIASRERNAAVSTTDFLQGLLASVNPGQVDGRLDITVREILDEASRQLESGLVDQPEVTATLHFVLGRSYANLAEFELAEHHLERSIQMREALDPPDESGILACRAAFGQIYVDQGAYAEAESLLVAALPEEVEASDAAIVSEMEASLSRVYSDLARFEEAEAFARRSVASADRIEDPRHVMHAQSRSEVGASLYRQGRYAEAIELLREAITTAESTVGPDHIVTGQCRNNLAIALGALGRNEEAIVELEMALGIYEDAYPPGHPEFATAHLNLADQYAATGQYETALRYYGVAREQLEAAYDADHVMIGLAVSGAAYCQWKSGDLAASSPSYEEAIRRLDTALGGAHPWVAILRCNLAAVYRESGDPVESGRLATEALEAMRASLPENHHHISRPLGVLAQLDMDAGDYASALVYAREAAAICVAALDEGHADRTTAEDRLAECLARAGTD